MIPTAIIEKVRKFLRTLNTSGSLKARAARGSVWLTAGNGLEQVFRLGRNMILTRILAPEAFGLMAIVIAVSATFESLTRIGISNAIVQHKRGDGRTYLNGAWWFACLRGIFLYVILSLAAPWLAQFYEKPELVPLMRVAFLTIVFKGLLSVEAYATVKRMALKRYAIIEHVGGICGILTAIVLTLWMKNVWALVIGFAVESAARCVLSYILCPFRPSLEFDRDDLRDLYRYARGMFGIPILTFIFMRADVFVVGKICPMNDLGLYSMAVSIASLPFNFITSLISQVALPAFSDRQDNKAWLNRSMLNLTALIVLLSFPMLAFVCLYGKDILSLVYGSQYGRVSIPFAIAFGTSMLRTCSVPIMTVYLSIGRPELHRLFTGVRAALILVLIVPAVKIFGLIGAASAGLLSMSIGYVFQGRRLCSITGLELWPYLKIFPRGAFISLSVVIAWALTDRFLAHSPIVHMIPGLLGCLVAYGLALRIIMRQRREAVPPLDKGRSGGVAHSA